MRATSLFEQFSYTYKDKVFPKQGDNNRMKFRYMYEMKDGKVIDSDSEEIRFAEGDDWSAKTVPARTLPNGGRTIRIEEE